MFLLVHDDSSEEALAACEGAVDNVALDGATRWGDKPDPLLLQFTNEHISTRLLDCFPKVQ